MNPGVNYLMLQPIVEESKTAAGIITKLDHQQDESPTKKGCVVKIGSRVNSEMLLDREIKTGMTVNYFTGQGTEIDYCGDTIVLVHIKGVSTVD